MLTLIENGLVYAPEPLGPTCVLIDMGTIIKVGPVSRRTLDDLDIPYEVIEAGGCVVTPGFIDPHAHLLGGSGEGSLSRQSPMIFLSELIRAGITTVVGALGVDTTMKTIAGLLGHVKGLSQEGITAKMWSGGYNLPPTSILSHVREDIMYIDEVVGAGETAISDERALQVSIEELAKAVFDTHIGGLLSGKSGVTHFHVGVSEKRLQPIRDLLDQHDIAAEWLYPTHVTRTDKLLDETIALVKKGMNADTDCIRPDTDEWVVKYFDRGGDPERFTLSSDSGLTSPQNLFRTVRDLVTGRSLPLERVLPLVTTNTSRILKLEKKGRLAAGCDGDVLVIDRDSFQLRHVIAGGNQMMRDGNIIVREHFLEESDRRIRLQGQREE